MTSAFSVKNKLKVSVKPYLFYILQRFHHNIGKERLGPRISQTFNPQHSKQYLLCTFHAIRCCRRLRKTKGLSSFTKRDV